LKIRRKSKLEDKKREDACVWFIFQTGEKERKESQLEMRKEKNKNKKRN